MNKIQSISLMFPLYKDRNTVKLMITKSSNVLRKLKTKYEIIIVDDGCPQNSGRLAKEIAKKFTNVKMIGFLLLMAIMSMMLTIFLD